MSLAGRQSSTLLAKTLSCRPLAFTGLVSYSFYLWHFPLFAFARNGNPNPTLAERLIWIVLSFVISVFSWRFIETPFRKSKRKSDLALALIAIGLIVAFCLGAITSKGFDFRVPKFLRGESNHTEILMFNNERCEGNDALQCVFSVDKKQKQRVILVGDSHADSLAGDLLQKVKSEAVNAFVYMARNNCPLMLGFTYPSMGCTQEVQQKRVELIESSAGDVVVYVGLMGWMQKRYRNDAEKLRATLRRIAKDRKLVLVYPIPSVGVHVPQYFNERARGFSANEAHKVLSGYPLTTSLAEHLKTHRELFKIYDSIEGDNVYRVYAHKAFCDTALKGRCIVNDAENVYYRDINHPSPAGSHLINEKIMTAIRQAIEH